MTDKNPDHKSSFWERHNETSKGILTILFWVAAIGGLFWFSSSHSNSSGPRDDGHVSQSYLYCWDTGDPSPHHLGHHVSGDHYCTDKELAK
jgi:hypothetical protein